MPLVVKLPRGERAGERVRPQRRVDRRRPDGPRAARSPARAGSAGRLAPPATDGATAPTATTLLRDDVPAHPLRLERPRLDRARRPAPGRGTPSRSSSISPAIRPNATTAPPTNAVPSPRCAASLAAVDRTLLPPAPADAETIAALGALGYLGTPARTRIARTLRRPARQGARGRAGPARPVAFTRATSRGDRGARAGVSEGDGSALAWQYLGASYDALGCRAEALAAYEQGSRLTGSSSYLAETAALRLLELGRPQAAPDLARDELDRHPENARPARPALARPAADRAGRGSGAGRRRRRGDRRQLADAFYQRAVVALARRDSLAAIGDLERAATLDGRHLEARKALAMLRHAQGDDAEARRLLGEVLAIDPATSDARADLAALDSAEAQEEDEPGAARSVSRWRRWRRSSPAARSRRRDSGDGPRPSCWSPSTRRAPIALAPTEARPARRRISTSSRAAASSSSAPSPSRR